MNFNLWNNLPIKSGLVDGCKIGKIESMKPFFSLIVFPLIALWMAVFFLMPRYGYADDFDFDGKVQAGGKAEATGDGKSLHGFKLKFEANKRKNIRGVFQIEGESDEDEVSIEDAYIRFKHENKSKTYFGYAKKRMGLEYYNSEKKRKTIERTRFYSNLNEFSYVGREMLLAYETDDDEEDFSYRASLSYSESNDTSLILSTIMPITGLKRGTSFHADLLFQHDRIDERKQFVWGGVFSVLGNYSSSRSEFELGFGVDPIASHIEKTFLSDEDIHFAQLKWLYAHQFEGEWGDWEPFFMMTYIRHNIDVPEYMTRAFMLGLNLIESKTLTFGLNAEHVATNSEINPDKFNYNESSFQFAAKYYF